MNKNLLDKLKQKLEKEKTNLEEELKTFANKDKKLEHDWDTRFPNFGEESDLFDSEKEADEAEEYSNLLPIEYALETKLKNINLALEKIKKNTYGKCEKCKNEIKENLLKICPETKLCQDCKVLKKD